MKRFNHFYKLIKEQEEIGDPMGADNELEMEPNFELPAKIVEPLAGAKAESKPGSLDDKFKSFVEFHVQLRAFHWATIFALRLTQPYCSSHRRTVVRLTPISPEIVS